MRFSADVRKERFEAVPPFVAYGDAASAPVAVSRHVRVVTAADHTGPCAIFGRWASIFRMSVSGDDFLMTTPAACCQSLTQRGAGDGCVFSTVTFATPVRLSLAVRRSTAKHEKAIKSATYQIVTEHGVAVAVPTTTTRDVAITQVDTADEMTATAVAEASPTDNRFSALNVAGSIDDGETTEALPGKIDKWRHETPGA